MIRLVASLLVLAVTLTGCVAGPGLLQHSTDNLQEMRADLRACTLGDGAWAFALIPDFGITADNKRVKCMKERGWWAGPDRSGNGIRDYARISLEECPDNYTSNGNGCSAITRAPVPANEPDWAKGE